MPSRDVQEEEGLPAMGVCRRLTNFSYKKISNYGASRFDSVKGWSSSTEASNREHGSRAQLKWFFILKTAC